MSVTPFSRALQHGGHVPVVLALVLPKHQQVAMDHDAAPQSDKNLGHLMMEDARAVGGPEEEPLDLV